MTCNADATAFRLSDGGTAVMYIPQCMWQQNTIRKLSGGGETDSTVTSIYVPALRSDISPGDYIIRGNISEITPGVRKSASRIIAVSVKDYGSPDMQHTEISVGVA